MANKNSKTDAEVLAAADANPLLAALRANDKKNLFKTNVTTAFFKTGFQLFDHFFGAVVNVHDKSGKIVRQEARLGQAAGTFNLVVGNTGSGKAQPVDTMIPTPTGWKRMGDLQIGDHVFNENGRIVSVVGVYPQGTKDVYKVSFVSGRTTTCCNDHLWRVSLSSSLSTKKMMTLKEINKNPHSYAFPKLTKPVDFSAVENVTFDPYVVGLAYGSGYIGCDGFLYIPSEEIAKKAADRLNMLPTMLMPNKGWGIANYDSIDDATGGAMDVIDIRKSAGEIDPGSSTARIPDKYLINHTNVRYRLLEGLIDASVHASALDAKASVAYIYMNVHSGYLKDTVVRLCRSLGMEATYTKHLGSTCDTSGNVHESTVYEIEISMEKSTYDHLKFPTPVKPYTGKRYPFYQDYIRTITNAGKKQCVCIKVSTNEGLYLTEDFIVTHNTTLTAQIAANIIRQFKYANCVHFDCEERFDVSRCETITRLPAYFFDSDGGGERYMIRTGMIGLDTIQEMIVKTYVSKMKLRAELTVNSGFKDEFNRDVTILQPTVDIIDSMTTVMSETFSPDSTKDAADAEKMRSNTEGARDAKTLKGFFKDILPLCKEADIIVYGINHLNTNMSMGITPVARQQNYLKQEESIPGGKTMLYYPFNIIKLTAKPSDDFTEETDGIAGHMVLVEPIKSSSNQSGNAKKGISFEMVFSHKHGFDPLRTLVMYGRERGIIEGNKTRLKFRDDPSFTFTFKDIYKEKDEKPIWESIKKFITPNLKVHLSFIEPQETGFDDRSLDY